MDGVRRGEAPFCLFRLRFRLACAFALPQYEAICFGQSLSYVNFHSALRRLHKILLLENACEVEKKNFFILKLGFESPTTRV
jgi:hypothetical protein